MQSEPPWMTITLFVIWYFSVPFDSKLHVFFFVMPNYSTHWKTPILSIQCLVIICVIRRKKQRTYGPGIEQRILCNRFRWARYTIWQSLKNIYLFGYTIERWKWWLLRYNQCAGKYWHFHIHFFHKFRIISHVCNKWCINCYFSKTFTLPSIWYFLKIFLVIFFRTFFSLLLLLSFSYVLHSFSE